ncbi:MAG TPA: adenylate/guanylate cyclase domain-containing protein [Rhizomicrobium sp.]|nr:adenylate/guanylate cyclase domain-containing protein [Rhizomicrobium sp.]
MQRKLAAILSADVVGYSGLMEADEAGTLTQLKANRAGIFDPAIAGHGGRIFKLIGDGALAEFPSVIAAVECALAIQAATEEAAAHESAGNAIRYRIGIHLGEVVVEGDDIYGDGVNLAARLQGLAPIGGVALSKMVRDSVEGKMTCDFDDLGEHTVKNIERPIHVFFARPAGRDVEDDAGEMKSGQKLSICVLPFANMSGDPEQEYFSDGISEDIITDLSKVSTLGVVSRNTAFSFKGKTVKVRQVANELKVSHVLEGSVRKAGGRVRITAQLIDGANDEHVWAERYDRDLDDIFALQDEISQAIVAALKLKLLPEEKKAIARRGTDNVEAYNIYLMARQEYVSGRTGDTRPFEALIRLCQRATEIDPGYAQAWALMALGQMWVRYMVGKGDGGLEAATRALAIDGDLAEAHAVKARILAEDGKFEEAVPEIEQALKLDPESHEVNEAAARLKFRQHKLDEAARHWEKAAALMDLDCGSPAMLITCYAELQDTDNMRRAAQIALDRVEKVLAQDRNNGAALGYGSVALATLGLGDRSKTWMSRALLIDPDNLNMRYNFGCALSKFLHDKDASIAMLEYAFARMGSGLLNHAKVDPDFDPIRDDPRFRAMMAQAEARLAADGG